MEIDWTCPNCLHQNVDALEETSEPCCAKCDSQYFWSELSEYVEDSLANLPAPPKEYISREEF